MDLILIVSLTLFFVNKVWFALIPRASECCLHVYLCWLPGRDSFLGFPARVAKAMH